MTCRKPSLQLGRFLYAPSRPWSDLIEVWAELTGKAWIPKPSPLALKASHPLLGLFFLKWGELVDFWKMCVKTVKCRQIFGGEGRQVTYPLCEVSMGWKAGASPPVAPWVTTLPLKICQRFMAFKVDFGNKFLDSFVCWVTPVNAISVRFFFSFYIFSSLEASLWMRFLSRGFLKTGSRFSFLLICTKAYLFRYCITQKFVRIPKFLHLSHLKALTLEGTIR